jgi:hypothetical protein
MFYLNEGTPFTDDFHNITNDYLKTLDVGNDSSPFFTDLDDDGDADLLIGSARNPDGTLFYFRNTGTTTNPEYLLLDSVYFGIQNELSISPAPGDIDGDGDKDLLIGNFNGTITLYSNIGSPSVPDFKDSGILEDKNGNPVDVGVYARPFLFDYDNDNDSDLAIGAFNGRFYFYKNTGTNQQYEFSPDTTYLYRLDPSDPDSPIIDVGDNSAPFLIDFDSDNDYDLFTGNREGFIYFYRNEGTNVLPLWTLVTNNFTGQDFGVDARPFFIDIDSDTDQDLFVGNLKGGLYLYRNKTITGLTDTISRQIKNYILINAYPNPFNSQSRILFRTGKQGRYSINIFDILGRKIKTIFDGQLREGVHNFYWNGKTKNNITASSGLYFLSARNKETAITIKLLFLK